VDVLRGLVMVIMALDHIRDFYSPTAFRPEDVTQTSVLFFFTRWITHLCAPVFIFLSGLSAFLYGRQRSTRQLSLFLLSRGFWLVAVEIVVFSFMLQWQYQLVLLSILWAIGMSMVLLAGLVWLPRGLVAAFALSIVAFHNLIPDIQPVTLENVPLALLHNSPFVLLLGQVPVLVAYTILPWTAVMAAGYVTGPWLAEAKNTRFLKTGLALLVVFVIVRSVNVYGDPAPWMVQPRGSLFTFLSFLNVTKYPPSLLFLCLTLGIGLSLLFVFTQSRSRLASFLAVYGRVPFFYFFLHFSLISLSAFLWTALSFGKPFNLAFLAPTDWPVAYQPSVLRIYLVWILLVPALYYPCRWFGDFKKKHTYRWLSYV